jgi:DNA polymerase-3 subunit gamma/tau
VGKLTAGELASLTGSLEGDLDEIIGFHAGGKQSPEEWAKEIGASILKHALKLEAEGVGDLIPVAHIRRASYWSRMAPMGKRKLLLIENADRMQDAARNALLKILEEPPERLRIVLTSAHGDALLPTLLSRLRPYRFFPRERSVEQEILRRVFRDAGRAEAQRGEAGQAAPGGQGAAVDGQPALARRGEAGPSFSSGRGLITAYLEGFLPVSGEQLYPLAAFFAASLAYQGIRSLRSAGLSSPPELEALGKHAAPIAEEAGLGRYAPEPGASLAAILKGAGSFKTPGLFSQFLAMLLTLISESLRGIPPAPGGAAFAEIWRKAAAEAAAAAGTYHQDPSLVLDRMGTELIRNMAAGYA